MSDIIGRVFTILLCVFFLTTASVLTITGTSDAIAERYAQRATTRFVTMVRNNGYLSKDMYMNYIEELIKTGVPYDVKMTGEHLKYVPVYDDNGRFLGGYEQAYDNTYEDEIMEGIMSGGDYRFHDGDYFYVSIKNLSPTIGTRMMQAILRISDLPARIQISYGGAIRNEAY